MSVIKFGLPTTDGLLCENFSCKNPANFILHCGPDLGETEIICCGEHRQQMSIGRVINRIEKLETPGNRNRPAQQRQSQKDPG